MIVKLRYERGCDDSRFGGRAKLKPIGASRRRLRMSVYRDRPEVIGTSSKRPERPSAEMSSAAHANG